MADNGDARSPSQQDSNFVHPTTMTGTLPPSTTNECIASDYATSSSTKAATLGLAGAHPVDTVPREERSRRGVSRLDAEPLKGKLWHREDQLSSDEGSTCSGRRIDESSSRKKKKTKQRKNRNKSRSSHSSSPTDFSREDINMNSRYMLFGGYSDDGGVSSATTVDRAPAKDCAISDSDYNDLCNRQYESQQRLLSLEAGLEAVVKAHNPSEPDEYPSMADVLNMRQRVEIARGKLALLSDRVAERFTPVQRSAPAKRHIEGSGSKETSPTSASKTSKRAKNKLGRSNSDLSRRGTSSPDSVVSVVAPMDLADQNANNETAGSADTMNNRHATINSNATGQVPSSSNDPQSQVNVDTDFTSPIMLRVDNDAIKVIPVLRSKFGENIQAKLAGEFFQIFTHSGDQYRNVSKFLREGGYESFMTTPVAKRPIAAVIRGIPTMIGEDEIMNDLVNKGFLVTKVIRKIGRNKQPIPLVTIILVKNDANAEIFKLRTCCSLVVEVEAARYSGPIQCYNCNGFNHTAAKCLSKPHCIKCGSRAHPTKDCKQGINPNPTCINCGVVGHTAAWKGCSKYPKLTMRRTNAPYGLGNYIANGRSYAAAAGNAPTSFPPLPSQEPLYPAERRNADGSSLAGSLAADFNGSQDSISDILELFRIIQEIFRPLGGIKALIAKIKSRSNPVDALADVLPLFTANHV